MFEAANVYINNSCFSSNAGMTFTQLWGAEDFFDVTLASGDTKQIKAHKIELLQWRIRREKTSEYAPVEQPWGQEVQLWPKQLQGDPVKEPNIAQAVKARRS